jgi:malate dehydrogenase
MRKKVSIIGAGRVGATTAQLIAYKEICDVVLLNRTPGTAQGIALDIKESAPLEGFDTDIMGTGDYRDIKDSEIVVLTAGVPRKEGMSRDDLLKVNAEIVKLACKQIKKYAPKSKLIVLTNPLDSMVYLAKKVIGFPKERVIGMAGILDSSRFKTFISMELKVSVKSIDAMVLGSHGDFMVPLPRHSTVDGVPIAQLMENSKIKAIIQRTKDGGAEIIKLEKDSSAFYAPASSLVAMVESILKDKKEVLPCAAYLEGEYGIKGIFMGVPVILGTNGMEKVIELELTKKEKEELLASASKVKKLAKEIDTEFL